MNQRNCCQILKKQIENYWKQKTWHSRMNLKLWLIKQGNAIALVVVVACSSCCVSNHLFREVERQIMELSELQYLFATKVAEQSEYIERTYEVMVDANAYVNQANKELIKATK